MSERKSASVLQENIYKTDAPRQHADLKGRKTRGIISEITKGKHCRILDVGCGDGSFLQPFSDMHECYGIDLSTPQLEKAKEKNIRAFRVDLETGKFPFSNDFFDLVICSETIEHLLDADNLLSETHRVLESEGSLVLTFPSMNQPVSWLMQIVFDLPPHVLCAVQISSRERLHYSNNQKCAIELWIRSDSRRGHLHISE